MTQLHERGVIFGLIVNQDVTFADVAFLNDSDFADPTYRAAFRAMRQLYARGASLNLDSVEREIKANGELGKIDFGALLPVNVSDIPLPENLIDVARQVRARAQREEFATALLSAAGARPATPEEMHEAIRKLTAIAEDVGTSDDLVRLADRVPEFLANIDRGRSSPAAPRVPYGIGVLDDKTDGMGAGDLVIVAGRPGDGKTVLGLQVADTVGSLGRPVAFFSLEMTTEELFRRLLSARSEVNGRTLRDPRGISDAIFAKLVHHGRALPPSVFVRDKRSTVAQIEADCRRLQRTEGPLGVVVVDYLDLIAIPRGDRRRDRHDIELGEITKSLKRMAKDLRCPVVLLVQLNRSAEQGDKLPTKSQLKNSGDIEQDADTVLLLHRAKRDDGTRSDEATVVIAKQRGGDEGTVKIRFRGEFARFEEAPGDPSSKPTHWTEAAPGEELFQ